MPATPRTGDEQLAREVADRVAAASRQGRLLSLEALAAELGVSEAEATNLAAAASLALVGGTKGKTYLYDPRCMTARYAELLLRLEERDIPGLIAATVREESRIYPRPTLLGVFTEPPFGLAAEEVEQLVAEMSNREEYGDICLVRASTGTKYLFSSRYLDPDYAKSLVEWLEVGQYENP